MMTNSSERSLSSGGSSLTELSSYVLQWCIYHLLLLIPKTLRNSGINWKDLIRYLTGEFSIKLISPHLLQKASLEAASQKEKRRSSLYILYHHSYLLVSYVHNQ